MNAANTIPGAPIPHSARSAGQTTSHAQSEIVPNRTRFRLELLFLALALAAANSPIFGGTWRGQLAFFPEAVAQGEWWRVLTHPFVHVSWYHLLLDGAAFFMLYAELRQWSSRLRLAAVAACVLGSLLAALTSPIIVSQGFGGLSGVAHGLMAISALEMIHREELWERRVGSCSLFAVVAKAAFEAATGQVALPFLHFGMMGTPVAACHAGGVIGGLACYVLLRRAKRPSVRAVHER